MNSPRHEEAVEAARQVLSTLGGLRSVVLFGSAAKGTAAGESDVDLLIDCDLVIEEEVRRALYALSDRLGVAFTPVFLREGPRSGLDTQLLESILRHGRPLVGTLPALTPQELDLQPLRLVSYRIENLEPRRRARLLRILDGYQTKKTTLRGTYITRKQGFLERAAGWRVGRGAVVVPEEAADELDAILHRFGATRSMVAIWAQRP